tara:strand:- start:3962 stop:4168 length:207 start_codon:yes stop_codon:yes gene_type:complete
MSKKKAIEICYNLRFTIENYNHAPDNKRNEQFESPKVKLAILEKKYKMLVNKYKLKLKDVAPLSTGYE